MQACNKRDESIKQLVEVIVVPKGLHRWNKKKKSSQWWQVLLVVLPMDLQNVTNPAELGNARFHDVFVQALFHVESNWMQLLH